MAKMASTSIVLSVIVFLLLLSAITSQADGSGGGKPKATGLIVEACKNASDKNENMGVTQEFCLSTLQSDNRSAEAKDLPGLLFVSLDILKGRVIDAGVKVKKMLQNAKKGTVTMYALNICEVEYEKMVSRLNICQAVIKDDKEGDLLSFRRLYHSMATMASTSIVLSVIVFLLLLSAITSQADGSGGGKPKATGLIVEACKNASDKNENMGGRVIDAGVKVKKMLQNAKKGTVTMYALNICEVEYEKMVSRLNICQAVIKDDKEGDLLSFRRLYHCVYMTDYNIQECGFELPNVRGAEAVLSQNDGLHIALNLNTCLVALYYDVK
ncbi:hypothetical protein ZWY2020_019609 [Hordeum vulgare]|nr:hypothetical protein ZWY2020_019609 [Hordeum vulgare]